MFRKKVRTILKAWIRATCYFQMEAFSTLLALLVTVHQNIYNLEIIKNSSMNYNQSLVIYFQTYSNLVIVFDTYVFSLVVILGNLKSIAIALSFSQCKAHQTQLHHCLMNFAGNFSLSQLAIQLCIQRRLTNHCNQWRYNTIIYTSSKTLQILMQSIFLSLNQQSHK